MIPPQWESATVIIEIITIVMGKDEGDSCHCAETNVISNATVLQPYPFSQMDSFLSLRQSSKLIGANRI